MEKTNFDKMKTGPVWRPALLLLLALCPADALSQSHPPRALYGPDALGRRMPEYSSVRLFRDDRYVGMFYFLWLRVNRVHDNSRILSENPLAVETSSSPPWGRPHAYHFWGEPMFGYYRSDDPWVLRRHAMLLSDAGVDFLVFDTTNAVTYDDVVLELCRVFDELRRLGEHVPKITFMVNSRARQTAKHLYETHYKPARFPDLWFHWKGKPLLICDPREASDEVARFFTLRKAHWPLKLVDTHNAWHWEATYPQVFSYDQDVARPEQISVSVGQNLHQCTGRVEMMSTGNARGRSYHDGRNDDRPAGFKFGFNFAEQWKRALELDPEVVFVTGWNEWVAMQLNTRDGPAVFCDQFSLEFSRDVEMMNGGYGDNYYMQMAANIRRFKGMQKPKTGAQARTIFLANSFRQWDDVSPYRDHVLDTRPRDFRGCGDEYYRVQSGRNNFRVLKVTHDQNHVYFYAETTNDITACTDPNWMWLLIDVVGSDAPSWEGFQFVVNRVAARPLEATLERCTGGWQWEPIGNVAYGVKGNEMHLAVPRQLLQIRDQPFTLQFKWIDNAQKPGDLLDAHVNGDTAPNGRFRYQYQCQPGS